MEVGLPLFAIAKQIQHKFPNENGKDIYFWFREGHLEKAPFNILYRYIYIFLIDGKDRRGKLVSTS